MEPSTNPKDGSTEISEQLLFSELHLSSILNSHETEPTQHEQVLTLLVTLLPLPVIISHSSPITQHTSPTTIQTILSLQEMEMVSVSGQTVPTINSVWLVQLTTNMDQSLIILSN